PIMRTEAGRPGPGCTRAARAAMLAVLAVVVLLAGDARAAEESTGKQEAAAKAGADWRSWQANNDVADLPSAQRGARNFASYCLGCHSLKYERWSRLGQDLVIPGELLQQDVLPPGGKATEYILTSMPATDAAVWFGKPPPDLSLM